MVKITQMCLSLTIVVSLSYAGGYNEAGGSNRGTYLSRGGYIIQSDDIIIDNYLSQYDYDYPNPDSKEFSVTIGTGYKDETGYIQIGLKGQKTDFKDLPPLNITFCIDRSGSMTHMLPWVKNSFYIFINKVRPGDIISLVDMNTSAQTLLPPTIIKNDDDRTVFKRLVDKIEASGGTDVYAGLKQSYHEVQKNLSSESVNRVVILTDGMHNSGEMINNDLINLAKFQNELGINVSTVILGLAVSTGFMVDLAFESGGSSRFVSDHDEMVKIFNTELDRLLVPVAKMIDLTVELNDGIEVKNTWGYDHQIKNNSITYRIPTLHNGDYETIIIETTGVVESGELIGNLNINYLDFYGKIKQQENIVLNYSKSEINSKNWTNDNRLLRTEGIIYFCRGLIDIFNKTEKVQEYENQLNRYFETSPQRLDIEQQIILEINQNIMIVFHLRNYLTEINTETHIDFYEKELEILSNYENTFNVALNSYLTENMRE